MKGLSDACWDNGLQKRIQVWQVQQDVTSLYSFGGLGLARARSIISVFSFSSANSVAAF